MNDWDRNNLNFILSMKDQTEWDEWFNSIDAEDAEYALKLVRSAIAENEMELMSLQEKLEQEEVLDCTQALEIINRVKKGASK